MRGFAVTAAVLALASTSPSAAEVTIKLDDTSQVAVTQLPSALDTCVAALMLRGDPVVCRSISQFLTSFSAEVRKEQSAQAKQQAAPAVAPAGPAN